MTQKQIGSSFYQELVAYGGLVGHHFTWTNDGTLEFFNDTPLLVISGVNAVYAAHDPSVVPVAGQVQAALSAGITIQSTATPSINGTYAINPTSQNNIIAIETGIVAGKGFPGGGITMGYLDIINTPHVFSESNFTNFAGAVRDYVYQIGAYSGGMLSSLPSATVMIA